MKPVFVIIILLASYCAAGQVKTKIFDHSLPARLAPADTRTAPIKKIIPSAAFRQMKSQARREARSITYKHAFATPVEVDVDLLAAGKITENNEYISYLLTISAEEALNLSVRFRQFQLPPGARLSIFSSTELTDSITDRENNSLNTWETRVYQGGQLSFYLKVPVMYKGKAALAIDQVRLGYDVFGNNYFGNPGSSANCNINVVCPQGTGWEPERNSVAMIISGGAESGTGALVMNTCGTNVPYLLTADHMVDANVTSWVFQFQTWSTACATNTGWREDIQFNGCQLLAREANTDFALVRLNQTPPANAGITYAGWNRNATAATAATGIHHPMGDLMKISHELNGVTAVAFQGGAADHWQVTFDQGIVQHGSSGSPLFDQNHRIVGQLHGNQNNGCAQGNNTCFCTQAPVGEYGRFDMSWAGGGTNSTRLSNWLDPVNTGITTTNTTDIANLLAPSSNIAIQGDAIICSGSKNYTVSGFTTGVSIQWSSSNTSIATVSGNGTQATVTKVGTGPVTITASGGNCFGSVSKLIEIGTPTSFFELNSLEDCFLESTTYEFTADLEAGSLAPAQYEWGYRVFGATSDVVLPWFTGPVANFHFSNPGVYGIYTRPINACGTGLKSSRGMVVVESCSPMLSLKTSPNPAKSALMVTVEQPQALVTGDRSSAVSFYLYRFADGKLVKQWSLPASQSPYRLSLHGVAKGAYVLTMVQGTRRVTKQLLVDK